MQTIMRIVVQRVKESAVRVDGHIVGQIQQGLLVLLGVAKGDSHQQVDFLVHKLMGLRIFDDANGKMNVSAQDLKASFLVVSQFTLLGQCDKGKRPSFDMAAEAAVAEELYTYFVRQLKDQGFHVETGQFGAMMDVFLINDGPVTFVLDK